MVSKWKRSIRKGYTSFLLFHFWDLKLVSIGSALSSASDKQPNLKIQLKCFWNVLCIAAELENVWTNIFLQIYILILTLWFLTLPCFLAKIAQISQKVILFFLGRAEEIETWFWYIWIAQRLKEVPPPLLLLFNFGHLQGLTCGQSWTKSAIFFINPSISFQKMFLFARTLPPVRILTILDHISVSKGPKSFQKGLFHGRWIGAHNFENFSLCNLKCYYYETCHDCVSS